MQTILNQIMPSLVPVLLVALVYWLLGKKHVTSTKMIWFVLILGIVFLTLTFIGGCYVLDNQGQVNAGYAVVPGIWTMICFGYYQSKK